MDLVKELELLFGARVALINIVSYEEERILRELDKLSNSPVWPVGAGLYVWDHADQFECRQAADPPVNLEAPTTIDTILNRIDEFEGAATFVLRDFHHAWESRRSITRKLRNLARSLAAAPHKNLILLTPTDCLPEELRQDVHVIDFPKPDQTAMEQLLELSLGASGALDGVPSALRERIARAALGLSSNQAVRVFRKAVVASKDGRLGETCLRLITEEKCRIIRSSGTLEFFPAMVMEQNVGGLEVLKDWLKSRSSAFGEEAARYGLDTPKGIALIGIPGTGKSLTAKLTAGLWKMPLLRLDMGAIFESLLGHTEQNLREAIQIAEVVSPSILWIDEIEKAFAGSQGDHGTATRVLGSFLTWMQERTAPVFVIATANNIAMLSPELLRRGRFDEVFFLDLPTRTERRDILEVHLRQRGYHQVAQRFDLDRLAAVTEGFVGAELEAIVRDAMFPAFQDGRRELETEDLLQSAADMVPLAKSHGSLVQNLRGWVTHGLARNASVVSSQDMVALDQMIDEENDFYSSLLN